MQDYYRQDVRLYFGHTIPSSIEVIQYDTSREIHFYLDDYIVPAEAEIRIYMKKPSGKEIYNHCLLVNDEIIMYPTVQMFAECGTNMAQIQIVKDNKTLTSFLFNICVHESYSENAIPSTNEFTILDSLIIEAREIIKAEAGRVEAENIRQENELNRIKNENSRIEAETNRETSENKRAEAESNRALSENNRNDAENIRIINENNRIAAEKKRQEDTSSAIDSCNTATENANNAADIATKVGETLEQKAQNGDFSATISSVKAVSGEPGTEASVKNTGTLKDAELLFTIPKRELGESAGFGTVSATISNTVGTPSVEVSTSGTDKAKNILFKFVNLKGEKGEPGSSANLVSEKITFSEASTRENIATGETLPVLLGKIKKFFSDLKTVAFSGSYTDLLNKPTIPAAVAVKGNAETTYRTGNVNLTPGNIGALPAANLINNLLATTAGYALDARQGKVLDDKITALNSKLSASIRTIRTNYGTSLIIPRNPSGGITHGLILEDHNRIYLLWVAGETNNWSANNRLVFGGTSNLTFSIVKTSGQVTVSTADKSNHGLLYIGW